VYCVVASKHVKYKTNTTYSSIAYPPRGGTAVIGDCSVTKTPLFFISHTITLLLVLSCVTILNNKTTLAFVSLLVQLTNNQSILSPASAGPISRRNFRVIHIIPFLQNIQAFLAALQVTEITASLTAKADRTDRRATTTTGESTRQQHSGNNKGNTTPVVVRTRMCRAYSTSPNLPRSGTLPNPNQSAARYRYVRDELVWTDLQYRPAGGTAPAVTHSNPYPYIRVL
jgi:hypothetical protein